MCLEKQHNAGSSTSGEGRSLFTQKLFEWFRKSSSITIPRKKYVYKGSWSLEWLFKKLWLLHFLKKYVQQLDGPKHCRRKTGLQSRFLGRSGLCWICSLSPASLDSLGGFLPRCWCCLWCLNVIYGKINCRYTVWEVHIGVSDTYRSYHCFCHSLYLWVWLQNCSVLAQLEEGR